MPGLALVDVFVFALVVPEDPAPAPMGPAATMLDAKTSLSNGRRPTLSANRMRSKWRKISPCPSAFSMPSRKQSARNGSRARRWVSWTRRRKVRDEDASKGVGVLECGELLALVLVLMMRLVLLAVLVLLVVLVGVVGLVMTGVGVEFGVEEEEEALLRRDWEWTMRRRMK